jgi:hypothetical protein
VCDFAGLLEGSSDSRTSADILISTAYRRQARSLHCQRDRFRERRAERERERERERRNSLMNNATLLYSKMLFQPQKLY